MEQEISAIFTEEAYNISIGNKHWAIEKIVKLLERQEEMQDAANNLVNKMQAVYDDPAYSSVWTISQAHVGPYKGPKWEKEFNELKAALKL